MFRTFFCWFLLLASAEIMAACCGSVACNCPDTNQDGLFFRFNVDSTTANGFKPSAVKNVYVVRHLVPDSLQISTIKPDTTRNDTVRLARTPRTANQPIIISNTEPFALSGSRKVNGYNYEIYVPKTAIHYNVRRIRLKGQFAGDKCCSCYENTFKSTYVNGQLFNATVPHGADPASKTILLNR